MLLRLPLLLFPCFLWVFQGCAVQQPATLAAEPRTVSGAEISYLALGDSYTIGEGVGPAERWPVQLAALARRQGIALQAPDIIARTGWTTAELQAAISAANNQRTYGLVSLLIGVNNQFRGQSGVLYRQQFRDLLHTAVRFAGGRPGRVFVLSIPDWGQAPFARRSGVEPSIVGAEIDHFNAVAQDECHQAGIAYIDITPLTRAAAGDAAQFARDGLHYSGPQTQRWAALALPVVRGLLP
ncbi:GDSL-type esterase/lipase family protein [Hymenobacter rubidus]|uniref:GDSL-type esterase/lipase family protein n=1 Tax=Hymenobacter rubidus TaxID=1441626 RepID=UPI00191FC405|nr:GDSL-type esterase/lipase family protein [Hymenobacter rubidus]